MREESEKAEGETKEVRGLRRSDDQEVQKKTQQVGAGGEEEASGVWTRTKNRRWWAQEREVDEAAAHAKQPAESPPNSRPVWMSLEARGGYWKLLETSEGQGKKEEVLGRTGKRVELQCLSKDREVGGMEGPVWKW